MPTAIVISPCNTQSSQTVTFPPQHPMLAETQWLFTEEELLRTPSITEGGLSPERERENRSKGVNFILQVGIMLKLPQITLATAAVFLHRFYMRHSMQSTAARQSFHHYEIGATSLFLATKVEENCRKMKELVIACVRVAQKDSTKWVDEQDKEYWRWRDVILHTEDVMLEAVCFDLSLESPYKILFELLISFGEESNKSLRNAAWAFVNDSSLSMLCLLFPSKVIATSALYAAARYCNVAFIDDENGRPWWDSMGTSVTDIRRACNYMADIYEGVSSKSNTDGGMYGHVLENGDHMEDKTRASVPGIGKIGSQDKWPATTRTDHGGRTKRGREEDLHSEQNYSANCKDDVDSEGTIQIESAKISKERCNSNNEKDQLYENDTQQSRTVEEYVNRLPNGQFSKQPIEALRKPANISFGMNADKDGLMSPRLDCDDVSEEGEVEA